MCYGAQQAIIERGKFSTTQHSGCLTFGVCDMMCVHCTVSVLHGKKMEIFTKEAKWNAVAGDKENRYASAVRGYKVVYRCQNDGHCARCVQGNIRPLHSTEFPLNLCCCFFLFLVLVRIFRPRIANLFFISNLLFSSFCALLVCEHQTYICDFI